MSVNALAWGVVDLGSHYKKVSITPTTILPRLTMKGSEIIAPLQALIRHAGPNFVFTAAYPALLEVGLVSL